MHFDNADIAIAAGDAAQLRDREGEACVRGCYRCLLSYFMAVPGRRWRLPPGAHEWQRWQPWWLPGATVRHAVHPDGHAGA